MPDMQTLLQKDMLHCKICGVGIGKTIYNGKVYEHEEQNPRTITHKKKQYLVCNACHKDYVVRGRHVKWLGK